MVSLDVVSGVLRLDAMAGGAGGGHGRQSESYCDDPPEALEHISLGPTVEELLELTRGQYAGGSLAGIAGIAGGFEGQVAGCGERPVSIGRRVHGGAWGDTGPQTAGGRQSRGSSKRGSQAVCGPSRGKCA
jgi:hypothetical protein